MAKTFLAKRIGDKLPYNADITTVIYEPRNRVKEYIDSPLGKIGICESAGVDKSRIWINVTGCHITVEATHDGVKKKFRRLRSEEAAELDAIEAQVKALHEKKLEVLARAWQKAHAVTVKELVNLIKNK